MIPRTHKNHLFTGYQTYIGAVTWIQYRAPKVAATEARLLVQAGEEICEVVKIHQYLEKKHAKND